VEEIEMTSMRSPTTTDIYYRDGLTGERKLSSFEDVELTPMVERAAGVHYRDGVVFIL
jgi:hypothetical protein